MNKSEKAKVDEEEKVFSIQISEIELNPNQPRKVFGEEALLKLADSISRYGIIQPLVVRKQGERYELVSGERRLRAAKEIGLSTVPCVLRLASDNESAEIAIIENLMREDLNVFEEAEAIQALIDTYSLTQEEIGQKLSCSQSYIANKLRLLRLTKETRDIILKNSLTERHARAILKIKDEAKRQKVLEIVASQGLNVSKTEALVEKVSSGETKQEPQKKTYQSARSFFESLSRAIEAAESSGIKIKSRKIESEDQVEITIIIQDAPKLVEKQENLYQNSFSFAKETV